MKIHFFRLLIFAQLLLLSFSCTIHKRTVNRGYFVQWYWQKNKISQFNNQEQAESSDSVQLIYEKQNPISIENEQTRTTSIKFEEDALEDQTFVDSVTISDTKINKLSQTVATKLPKPLKKVYQKRLSKIQKKKGENKEKWRHFTELFLIISLALLGAFLILFPLYLIKGWWYISPILQVIYFAIPACLLLALICFVCSFIF